MKWKTGTMGGKAHLWVYHRSHQESSSYVEEEESCWRTWPLLGDLNDDPDQHEHLHQRVNSCEYSGCRQLKYEGRDQWSKHIKPDSCPSFLFPQRWKPGWPKLRFEPKDPTKSCKLHFEERLKVNNRYLDIGFRLVAQEYEDQQRGEVDEERLPDVNRIVQ